MTSTYAVTGVLERRQTDREGALLTRCALAAFGLHALLAIAALVLPRLEPEHKPPIEYVAVQIVPAARLGVERPRPSTPPPPAPEPPKAEPKPAPPEIAPPPDTPTLREPAAAKPAPKPGPAPAATKPAPQPAAPAAEPEVQGSERGSTNALALGAAVAGLDNPDFVYGYYVDQMLSMIQRNWVRPMVGSGVEATVHYRIQRDGRIVEVRIATSSGINSFDLAALRAVQSSTPLPPLPRAFREGSLGVNLIFR
ncbi:MAG: TonB C-terminal domain-containing protein [Thermoanaerobaculia bacterium]|nr:TonB C-terminal domain-containing protein [Thermoanaerobaculia bacterium]MBP9822722.1 TonB C-terminal domain-containing protein [Thermoanaerobaculia bacterium]